MEYADVTERFLNPNKKFQVKISPQIGSQFLVSSFIDALGSTVLKFQVSYLKFSI